MSATYKVSYVVTGEDHPGAILNLDHCPEQGDNIQIGRREFKVVEVIELIPAQGEFHYLHATLQPLEQPVR